MPDTEIVTDLLFTEDCDGDALLVCVFDCVLVADSVSDTLAVSVGNLVLLIVGDELCVFDIADDAVNVTELVEVFELLLELVSEGVIELVFDHLELAVTEVEYVPTVDHDAEAVLIGVPDWVSVLVIVAVFEAHPLVVRVGVLELNGLADIVVDAEVEPEIVWLIDCLTVPVIVCVKGAVNVILREPVPDTDTVDVLLLDGVLVFVVVAVEVLVVDTDDVKVLVPLVDAECVDETVDVFVPMTLRVLHDVAVLVFELVTVDVVVRLI